MAHQDINYSLRFIVGNNSSLQHNQIQVYSEVGLTESNGTYFRVNVHTISVLLLKTICNLWFQNACSSSTAWFAVLQNMMHYCKQLGLGHKWWVVSALWQWLFWLVCLAQWMGKGWNNGVRARSRADRWHVGESHRYLLQRYRQYPMTPARPCIASWVCSDLSQPNRWHGSKKSHGATGSLPVCKRTKFLLKEASQFLLRHGYIGASSVGIRALMPFFLFEAV